MLLQALTPVPKDIPLPLPIPESVLVVLLIVSFLLHIVFINLMVGGSMITLWAQIKGLKEPKFDQLAHEIAKTITVNKSLAVVLGVAPLLSINTLYTVYFYSANALTGFAWIMIIPLVTVAFLLTYLHKYTWTALASHKKIHISIIGLATGIFLIVPFIFLTNVNLMMFPEKWGEVNGFFSALVLPNVFPRYFEFIGACLAVSGIALVWYNNLKNYPVERIYNDFSRYELKKLGFSIGGLGLLIQIVFGVLVLFTLPSKGIATPVILLMVAGGGFLALALWLCYQSVVGQPESINRYLVKITFSMVMFLVIYGGSRQLYRHNALDKHQELMAVKTAEFLEKSKYARENPQENTEELELDPSLGDLALGAAIFKSNCAACHAKDQRLVGPPMTEMVAIYASDQPGLKNWIKAPGKKRADMPQMPGFPQLSEADLQELSKYILSIN